jgi:hypothetical protein
MQQLIYVMQFTGKAAPVAGKSNVMKASTSAPSCTVSTAVKPEGVSATLQPATGGKALFESEVTVTGETSFLESGSIRFGDGNHRLRFSTVGQGYMSSSADPALKHGTVTWRIDSGEGQFAQASGLITSNFTISEAGDVTDNHLGIIFVR